MTTPTGDSEREIRFVISTEIADANRDIEEFRAAVAGLKTIFKDVQTSANASFQEVSKVIKDNLKDIKISIEKDGPLLDLDADVYKEAVRQLTEENKRLEAAQKASFQGAKSAAEEYRQKIVQIKNELLQ